MRILLDTHVLLWWLNDDPKLSEEGRALIVEAQEAYVSSASIWEAAIKAGLGKLDVDIDLLAAEIARGGFTELPITFAHAAMVRTLPELHRDPFDRILIAQAIVEPLHLITSDAILTRYPALVKVV